MSEKTAKTDRREVRRAFGEAALKTFGEFEHALAHHTLVLQGLQQQHIATDEQFREIQAQLLRHSEALTLLTEALDIHGQIFAAFLARERAPFWRRWSRVVCRLNAVAVAKTH